ncbi:UNVERIFIED_ORG: hypothetical protein J2W64_003850 [Rahnella aquatilis]|uniref:hypothetical protein n=1 Tax=Rahnella sp. 2050 TaxID=3156425 RepID=UPI001B5D1DF1|nr:hypothetical protein [Rahnella aquatilis]
MANYGIQTWSASGTPNNTGLVKILILGSVYLSKDQVSGSWSYSVPPGYKVAAMQSPVMGAELSSARRKITTTTTGVSLSSAGADYSTGTFTAAEGWLIVYLVKQ